ncbi:hypothetical protein BDZ91DRAFT_795973 [Kalaharituber pfeilii]|nr:hypothetical protein BDZ91DRAFT_795973 [Kalaharituber pfeilii]
MELVKSVQSLDADFTGPLSTTATPTLTLAVARWPHASSTVLGAEEPAGDALARDWFYRAPVDYNLASNDDGIEDP